MIFRLRRYKVISGKVEAFNEFFLEYLLPVQQRHGARLVGRWATEDGTQVFAIWVYESREHYEEIHQRVVAIPTRLRRRHTDAQRSIRSLPKPRRSSCSRPCRSHSPNSPTSTSGPMHETKLPNMSLVRQQERSGERLGARTNPVRGEHHELAWQPTGPHTRVPDKEERRHCLRCNDQPEVGRRPGQVKDCEGECDRDDSIPERRCRLPHKQPTEIRLQERTKASTNRHGVCLSTKRGRGKKECYEGTFA
jgi:hypothetical protein